MADRIIDDADLAVDELKRKARRRLVGAIVLALAAAILIPLLLEKEPKTLGGDVSIQIPPVDDSKFVSSLTADKSKDARSDAKAVAEPAGKSDVAAAPPATPAVTAPPAPVPAIPAAPADTKVAAAIEKSSPAPRTVADPPSTPQAAPDVDPASVEGFVVQLAAFTDEKGANALANRLKKTGYPAYNEAVETDRGTLWRVRVGGFPSRAAAAAVRAKLKAEGHKGIVAAAK